MKVSYEDVPPYEAGVGAKRCKLGSEAGGSGSRAYSTAALRSVDSLFCRLYS
jgi:hypothetical protein